jgi:hypothetical protein
MAAAELWFKSEDRLERLRALYKAGVVEPETDGLTIDMQRGWVTRFFAGKLMASGYAADRAASAVLSLHRLLAHDHRARG